MSWLACIVLAAVAIRLRRRLELVARAEHELRGPLTALALAAESARRGRAVDLDSELERARCALADLTAARQGRRSAPRVTGFDLERLVRSAAGTWGARLDWRAGRAFVEADRGRVAQAVGNLLANAAEHGCGTPIVVAHPSPAGVRVCVANERGRGLKIAAGAARDAGGRIALERDAGEFRATLELPVAS